MNLRYVDVHCFAGGLALGIRQNGFELQAKKESVGAYGARNMEVNRHIMGDNWETQAASYEEWEPTDAELVIGNPPCSGFSLLSTKSFRGIDSRANACMWGITEYAAKIAPPIFAFESVQGAYTVGGDLMRQLRTHLENLTGFKYDLTHVLHSARSCGSPQLRRRYMFIAHRVPFGLEYPDVIEYPNVKQAIGDLEGMNDQWEPQLYKRTPSYENTRWAWHARQKSGNYVDGHKTIDSLGAKRIAYLLSTGFWTHGKDFSYVLKNCYENGIDLPEVYARKIDKLIADDFNMGWNTPQRLLATHTCPAITGSGAEQLGHYRENRILTHREIARLMGFPDDWKIAPNADYSALRSAWGKGVTVDVGRYFGQWLKNSLEENPGAIIGDEIGERERLINFTNRYPKLPKAA
jgi:site-specific DNA-cytosine methylase